MGVHPLPRAQDRQLVIPTMLNKIIDWLLGIMVSVLIILFWPFLKGKKDEDDES